MDPKRGLEIDRLRSDIEATRASIARTASELRWKAGEAMQWETYVKRHPVPILATAAVVGVVVGRRVARALDGGANHDPGQRGWTSSAAGMDTVPRLPARHEQGGRPLAAMNASWQRLGSRIEGLVNRMIDDVADTAERLLVPALVGGVEKLFATGRPRPVAGSSYHSPEPEAEGRSA
jgi:hypothetical protein